MTASEITDLWWPSRPHDDPAHFLNAYTWAGRRGECGVTSEWLHSVHEWERVTCERCLAARPTHADADQSATDGASSPAEQVTS